MTLPDPASITTDTPLRHAREDIPALSIDTPVNAKRCAKCACNPRSPERSDPYGYAFMVEGWTDYGIPFFCHESVPGHEQEELDGRQRWRLCAGWHKVVGSVDRAITTARCRGCTPLRPEASG